MIKNVLLLHALLVLASPALATTLSPSPDEHDLADPAVYRATAAKMGTDAGIAYRYGPDAAAYGTPRSAVTYPGPRPSKSYQTLSIQRKERQKDGVAGNRSCGADSWCGEYQLGDRLRGDPGDFSSSIVNVGYIPDAKPPAGFPEPRYWGVASLQTVAVAHGTISWKPEPSWTTYAGPVADGGANDENTVRLAGVRSGSPIGSAPLDGKPVASARGYGRGGWTNNVLTVFANGWITSAGSNTSHNFLKMKLPDGKTPTALAITNSGEFAFVTVWDTAALKGQVAVIALSEGCQWCETKPEAEWDSNWGSNRQAYPGMPGLGNYLGAKLIGFVDLPDSLRAPTEISVTTGKSDTAYQTIRNYWNDHLMTEASRKRRYDGDLADATARTGMAVVISKSEKRAAFIDLRPLFQYYRTQYLTKNQADWHEMIASRGPAPTQWPYTFDIAPVQKPGVVKVTNLPERPTAVKLSLEAPYRAFIATQEGKLRVFDLGNGYLDQRGVAVGKPEEIVEKFAVAVGKNPTSIAYMKEKAAFGPNNTSALYGARKIEQHLWVLSRGERKASLLRFDAGFGSASIVKILQDSRLVDPIAIEDVDNHGTESYILTVADYAGKAVRNYPYGPIIAWTYDPAHTPCPKPRGCGLLGGKPFEYAGSYALPGKPFHLGGANIN